MADSVGNGNKTGFRPTLACQTNITPRQEKVHFQILIYPIKHLSEAIKMFTGEKRKKRIFE